MRRLFFEAPAVSCRRPPDGASTATSKAPTFRAAAASSRRLARSPVRRGVRTLLARSFAAVLFASCVGTTGNELVTFDVAGAGSPRSTPGTPYEFETDRGFRVSLERARLFIGAVYLNASKGRAFTRPTSCVLPGIYVGQVRQGRVIDALDPALQSFPVHGDGTADRAFAGELWLSGGDIDQEDDPTVIVDVQGTARRAGEIFPFSGRVTIGGNRRVPPSDEALPGSNPICQQRIVGPIDVDLALRSGGTLVVRVSPEAWFRAVDFSELERGPGDSAGYVFRDARGGSPSDVAFYNNVRSRAGAYSFEWSDASASGTVNRGP